MLQVKKKNSVNHLIDRDFINSLINWLFDYVAS